MYKYHIAGYIMLHTHFCKKNTIPFYATETFVESRTIHASGGVVQLGTLLHPCHRGLVISGDGTGWIFSKMPVFCEQYYEIIVQPQTEISKICFNSPPAR